MPPFPPDHQEESISLTLAVIASSAAPLLLLTGDLAVVGASTSFCTAFRLDPDSAKGCKVFELGHGEWDIPQFRSLLAATASGKAEIEAYEMDLKRNGQATRHLVLNARKLDYTDKEHVRLLLAVADVTDARADAKIKDDLLREKSILLQELQHRVANSLQIIASVLMQSARKVQSEESRGHLHDAHSRVMSVAAVQRQLSASTLGEVALRPYLTDLCASLGASMIRDPEQLSLTVTSEDALTSSDISLSLGLIVTELVINALKHAFPDNRKGKIQVAYRSGPAGWVLSVQDDGVGISKDRARATPGLGTSIVEALARQLNARVQITDARPGTIVSITHASEAAAEAANDENAADPSVAAPPDSH